MSNVEKLQEAVNKLTAALSAVDAANELMARVKEDVKDMDLNPSALIFAIKRVQKRKLNPEPVELQDELYEQIWENELV